MVGPQGGEKGLMTKLSRFDTVPAFDGRTDGGTDAQASCDCIVRAMHTRRAVKT